MAENQAAWINEPLAHPFVLKTTAKPKAGPRQLVIKNSAVAINPADWKIQTNGGPYLDKYPFVLGMDAAGVVEEVGAGVTRFQKGQRVLVYCNGMMTRDPANSAFQQYILISESNVVEIPDSLSFEQAAVLPLAVATASAGLYPEDYLNLPLPSITPPKPVGRTLLVWGGASSVGSAAIQLATASGLTVLTTASAANHDFVKSLGAHAVFDYRSSTVVEDIVSALANSGEELTGVYDAISEESSFVAVSSILEKLKATVRVVSVLPYDKPTEKFAPKFVIAYNVLLDPYKHIGEWIWGKFLPQALANGTFQAKPDPLVVGKGIQDIQHGVDVLKKGVSARKIVVSL